jgi:hypothetical protein
MKDLEEVQCIFFSALVRTCYDQDLFAHIVRVTTTEIGLPFRFKPDNKNTDKFTYQGPLQIHSVTCRKSSWQST